MLTNYECPQCGKIIDDMKSADETIWCPFEQKWIDPSNLEEITDIQSVLGSDNPYLRYAEKKLSFAKSKQEVEELLKIFQLDKKE